MLLRLLTFTCIPLLANALVPQQIIFTAHHLLHRTSSPTDLHPLTTTKPALQARPTTVYRPRSIEALHNARLQSMRLEQSPLDQLEWDTKEVLGPDVEHRHTLAQLARMAGNAYALPGWHNWYDVDQSWNNSFPFGWEDTDDGFRGHVFISGDNSTIVLSIKGTTVNGPTTKKDKFNDNLLFSCCCARGSLPWVLRGVCNCYAGKFQCDSTCLSKALIDDSLFYSDGVRLIEDLIHLYPHANIWLTGHSLGGALASLLGATYGLPAVAFESPGERLAASRLNLIFPPLPSSFDSTYHPAYPHLAVTHVYHTGDPIPLGTCNGFLSACAQAGYALDTKCHLGKSIVFDTVGKLGWHVDVRTHIIKAVITRMLEAEDVDWGEPVPEWPPGDDDDDDEDWWDKLKKKLKFWKNKKHHKLSQKEKREVPGPIIEEDCMDCFKWDFGDYKDPGDDDDDDDIPEPRDPGPFDRPNAYLL